MRCDATWRAMCGDADVQRCASCGDVARKRLRDQSGVMCDLWRDTLPSAGPWDAARNTPGGSLGPPDAPEHPPQAQTSIPAFDTSGANGDVPQCASFHPTVSDLGEDRSDLEMYGNVGGCNTQQLTDIPALIGDSDPACPLTCKVDGLQRKH